MCNGVRPDGHRRPSTNAMSTRSSPPYHDEQVEDEGTREIQFLLHGGDTLGAIPGVCRAVWSLLRKGRALLFFLCARTGCEHPRGVEKCKFDKAIHSIHLSQFLIVSVSR
jgi:hypothetical protein